MSEETARGLEALLRWAAGMGISDSPPPSTPHSPSSPISPLGLSLFISDFPGAGGRGLAAVRDLTKGELVLRVPRTALLTSDSVLKDENISSCVRRYPRLSPTQILIVCLLAEVGKGRSSKWYAYLLQLPQYYNTLANFTNIETESLQVEDAIWVAEKAIHNAESNWKEVVPLMKDLGFKPKLMLFKTWLWASAIVSSRSLHIPWDKAGCLCPVGDLFNYAAPDEELPSQEVAAAVLQGFDDHSHVEQSLNIEKEDDEIDSSTQRLTDGRYEEEKASYCFYARKSYRFGEQVLLSYGTYTNLELVEHYGFLLSNNPNEKAFIQLDREMYTVSTWPTDSLYIQSDGSPSFALLCALRLWATPVNHRRSVGHLVYSGSLVSVKNELVVMKWLVKSSHEALQRMPTTVEFDDNLLVVLDEFRNSVALTNFADFSFYIKELGMFLQVHGLDLGATYSELPIRVRRSLERWKLAIQWRCCYKKALVMCSVYCKDRINELSSQTVGSTRHSEGSPGATVRLSLYDLEITGSLAECKVRLQTIYPGGSDPSSGPRTELHVPSCPFCFINEAFTGEIFSRLYDTRAFTWACSKKIR